MKLRKYQKEFLRFIGNLILYTAINLLAKTLRLTLVNNAPIKESIAKGEHFVLAFWHGTMFFPWYYHRNQEMLGLTSQSKDGDVLARLLKKWNYKVMRGSSSKGGDVALGIMVDFARFEGAVAVTPDGPRGPRHKMKAGAVITAKKGFVPLYLLGVGYSKKITLKNWDKFEIPKPFSEVKMVYSNRIKIDKDLSFDETSAKILECEELLNKLQEEAGRFKN